MVDKRADLRLLGPFEVWINGRQVDVGQPKQRALLALLALRRGALVPLPEIIDALWGDMPPKRVRNQIQVYVSSLRRIFANAGGRRGVIRTRTDAYLLDLPPECVDLEVFGRAVARAGELIRNGDWNAADQALRAALSCWRGQPLGDVRGEFFDRFVHQLEERRVTALELRLRVKLAMGHSSDLVDELRSAVSESPLHEGLRHGLMLALYHSGRPAEALVTYHDGRKKTLEQLGIEPGPELRALELRILRGEPMPVTRPGVRS